MTPIPCLSVRQPSATLLVSGIKPVENRSWWTDYRGPLLIHASAARPKRADVPILVGIDFYCQPYPTSAILGYVELYDIVTDSTSRWAIPGEYHWLVRGAHQFPEPMAYKGKLKLWYPDPPIVLPGLVDPTKVVRGADGSMTAYY